MKKLRLFHEEEKKVKNIIKFGISDLELTENDAYLDFFVVVRNQNIYHLFIRNYILLRMLTNNILCHFEPDKSVSVISSSR